MRLLFVKTLHHLILWLPLVAFGATPSYPPQLPDAREYVYKKASGSDLKLWVFQPQGQAKRKGKPAIVLFFGGGWRSGTPAQFEKQCEYLASRGMVAVTADYRVSSRQKTQATACVEDAKSAVRWMRQNSSKLGIDPKKIAVGGGSAGGHVAAAIGTVKGFEAEEEDLGISSKPDALVLFNPAVALSDIGRRFVIPEEKKVAMQARVGTEPKKLSPYHHLSTGLPPTIIFHGTRDDAVPFLTVRLFEKRARELDADCRLVSFPEKPHGFFNWGRFANEPFRKSMLETDLFLSKLGWLKGEPTIENFIKAQN